MEEKNEVKTKKASANGLVLTVLVIAAIVIAFMWVAIYNLNNDNGELQNRIDASRRDTEILKGQVLFLQDKLGVDENTVSNETSNEVENKVGNEVDNEVDNEVSNETENKVGNEVDNEVSNNVRNAVSNKVSNTNE